MYGEEVDDEWEDEGSAFLHIHDLEGQQSCGTTTTTTNTRQPSIPDPTLEGLPPPASAVEAMRPFPLQLGANQEDAGAGEMVEQEEQGEADHDDEEWVMLDEEEEGEEGRCPPIPSLQNSSSSSSFMTSPMAAAAAAAAATTTIGDDHLSSFLLDQGKRGNESASSSKGSKGRHVFKKLTYRVSSTAKALRKIVPKSPGK